MNHQSLCPRTLHPGYPLESCKGLWRIFLVAHNISDFITTLKIPKIFHFFPPLIMSHKAAVTRFPVHLPLGVSPNTGQGQSASRDSLPSQTQVQTSQALTPQGSPPAPISDTPSVLLLWQWHSSWEVTLGLREFNHFPCSPDLQQVITRRQINNHKWTVQKAGWWVLWHFKHLLDSKEWKPGWMQSNRAESDSTF